MCLHVFTEANKKNYEELRMAAMKLGAAFQKVNFLRDMQSDFRELGRTYFPHINFESFSEK
jgi:phytoene/squalene synthetase